MRVKTLSQNRQSSIALNMTALSLCTARTGFAKTGIRLAESFKPRVPIAAMRRISYEIPTHQLRNTDAAQNVTEALLAVQLAKPRVYVAMHNRLLPFPGAVKDRREGTFVLEDETLGR